MLHARKTNPTCNTCLNGYDVSNEDLTTTILLQQIFDESPKKALDSNPPQTGSANLPARAAMIESLATMNRTEPYSSLPEQQQFFYDESRPLIAGEVFKR
eukprot:GHVU01229902.1.p3 GENE.GHVU01229902.1~~GHVU01229902.1.p3  ORF type:complete len:100 (+),score=14.50 GHVU01229902.1:2512-2811(+)